MAYLSTTVPNLTQHSFPINLTKTKKKNIKIKDKFKFMIHFRSFKNTLPLSRACGLYLPDGHTLLYIFLLKILLLMLQKI